MNLRSFVHAMNKSLKPHVDLVEGREHSIGILGFLETFGNAKPHTIHLDSLFRSCSNYFTSVIAWRQLDLCSFQGLRERYE